MYRPRTPCGGPLGGGTGLGLPIYPAFATLSRGGLQFSDCSPGRKGRTGPRAQRAGGPRQGREKRDPERGEAPTGLGLPGAPSGGGRAGGGRGEPHHTQRVAERQRSRKRWPHLATAGPRRNAGAGRRPEVRAPQPEREAPDEQRSHPTSTEDAGGGGDRKPGGEGSQTAHSTESGRPTTPPAPQGRGHNHPRAEPDTASRAARRGEAGAGAPPHDRDAREAGRLGGTRQPARTRQAEPRPRRRSAGISNCGGDQQGAAATTAVWTSIPDDRQARGRPTGGRGAPAGPTAASRTDPARGGSGDFAGPRGLQHGAPRRVRGGAAGLTGNLPRLPAVMVSGLLRAL